MARYKEYSYEQGKLIPIHFEDQILPGTFEYTINYLIDNELDLSVFEGRYRNEETGAPACDPAILLKIVLFAYSRGSRRAGRSPAAARETCFLWRCRQTRDCTSLRLPTSLAQWGMWRSPVSGCSAGL
jgi:hypothetical protein